MSRNRDRIGNYSCDFLSDAAVADLQWQLKTWRWVGTSPVIGRPTEFFPREGGVAPSQIRAAGGKIRANLISARLGQISNLGRGGEDGRRQLVQGGDQLDVGADLCLDLIPVISRISYLGPPPIVGSQLSF